MEVIKHNLGIEDAMFAVKEAISNKAAILSEKNNVLKVGAPMMTATIKVFDDSIEVDGSGAGKMIANTCISAIRQQIEKISRDKKQDQNNNSNEYEDKYYVSEIILNLKKMLEEDIITKEQYENNIKIYLDLLFNNKSNKDNSDDYLDIEKEIITNSNPLNELEQIFDFKLKNSCYVISYCKTVYTEYISIPEKYKSYSISIIGRGCFWYCNKLKEITIPKTIIEIEAYPFENCDDLRLIKYLGTKSEWEKIEKNKNWNTGLDNCIIECIDGEY